MLPIDMVLEKEKNMKYEELVKAVRDSVQNAKVSKMVGHVAFQFNIEGEAEGAFYLEISEGKIFVEPYEYYDRNLIIVTSAEVVMDMVAGKVTPRVAYTNGLLKAFGEIDELDVLPLGCESQAINTDKVNASVPKEDNVTSEQDNLTSQSNTATPTENSIVPKTNVAATKNNTGKHKNKKRKHR